MTKEILERFVQTRKDFEKIYESLSNKTMDINRYIEEWGLGTEDHEIMQNIEEREESMFWRYCEELGWAYEKLEKWCFDN